MGDVPELLAVVTLRVAGPLLLLCGAYVHWCASTRLCACGREVQASGRVGVAWGIYTPYDSQPLKVPSYLEGALGEIIPITDIAICEKDLTKKFGTEGLLEERTCEVV